MSNKHTPGPWEAISNLVRTRCTPDGNGGFLIAECPPSIGNRLENARLIAAAPELLEALERLVAEIILSDVDMEYIDSHFMPHIEKARAAIAKATGE